MPSLGERLRKLRVIQDLTQKEVAAQLTMSDARYNQYENDRRSPDYETLKKISAFYNVSTDYLLSNTEERIEKVANSSNDVRDIMEEFAKELEVRDGLLFNGEPLSPEACHGILDAMKLGLEIVLQNNKKYTTKKRKSEKNSL